jgi:hypothetical protein
LGSVLLQIKGTNAREFGVLADRVGQKLSSRTVALGEKHWHGHCD